MNPKHFRGNCSKAATLKDTKDTYKGVHIGRTNENSNCRCGGSVKTIVKYSIDYKGVTLYFKTQDDAEAFIDRSDIAKDN